jgi:hypothetical protein
MTNFQAPIGEGSEGIEPVEHWKDSMVEAMLVLNAV